MTSQGMIELEEITGFDGRPDCLPQLVLGYRVHTGGLDDSRIIAMDDLAEDPHVGVLRTHRRQDRSPELRIDGVGGVESPTVDTAVRPVVHDPGDELANGGVVMVEGDEVTVALKDVGLTVTPADHPSGIGVRPGHQGILHDLVTTRDVVEHPVKQYRQATGVSGIDKVIEVGVVAEARIDGEIVQGVVTMAGRGEDRPQCQA